MEATYIIWGICGFMLGCLWIGGLKDNKNRNQERSSVRDDMEQLLAPYIGQEVNFDFYEDEEDWDMLGIDKSDKAILLDVDSRWAMLRLEKSGTHKDKLIRISSVKGVSVKE